ncbi:e3 ubiquitin-protein ligase [Gigaspora margarita]|uniref:E3 ubiquitin-protein ligase n=1 Tax=Gigaspora margarita TaxID=4874 RepID=A0A8H4AGP5_GIGMA|nr:e3 ubiquitin-protein ligase [Gigaspora margarita]
MVNGLKLKHAVALYELVEKKIADVEIEYLSDKYKVKILPTLKDEINEGVDFEQSNSGSGINKCKILHRAFAVFIDCWPIWVPENVIRNKFPKSLLAANIYDTYQYTTQNVKKARSNKINNSLQRETPLYASTSSNIRGINHGSHGNRGGRRGHGYGRSNPNDRM